MTLKNISLPSIVLANLYKDSLVQPLQPEKKVQLLEGVDVFGGYKSHILFLIDNSEAAFLTDTDLRFLSDILTACKLSMKDVGIVNTHQIGEVLLDLSNVLKAQIIIAAGVENSTLGLPFNIPNFQAQSYQNKKYAFTPPLSYIKSDPLQKKKLWVLLKSLFSL